MNPKTPGQAMVAQKLTKPAPANTDKEMRYIPFASDTEIKLTVAIVTNLVCIPTRSGARCTPEDALRFMMMCQARKLNPFEGDAFLQGYDSHKGPVFSLITAHQAFLKRAEVNKEFDGMESGVLLVDNGTGVEVELHGDYYNKDQFTLVGAWARVHHKQRKFPTYRRLDLDVFCKRGNDGKAYGRWADDPAGMIVKCAEADALRSTFPSMLGNLYLEHELNPGEEKNVTPPPQIDAPSFITAPAVDPVVEAPAPRDNLEQSRAPDEEKPVTRKAEPAKDITEGLEPAQVQQMISDLIKRDGVNDDMVTAHLRSTKVAKANQSWPDLSDSKLRTLANMWNSELPAIKAVEV